MKLYTTLLLLTFALLFAGCSDNATSAMNEPDPEEPPVVIEPVVITLENSGAQSYRIVTIDGDGAAAALNEDNVDITLQIGLRFTFVNTAGASSHPLDFRNDANEKLFGQSNASGMLNDEESIDVVKDGNSITFTLTDELAEVLANYVCSFHPGMGGKFITEAR